MKRVLCLFGVFFIGICARADIYTFETNLNKDNFWEKNGIEQQKVLSIGEHIINVNQLNKRIPIQLEKTPKVINAYSRPTTKMVTISSGLLPYIENDDEMAFILGHEMAHSIEAYGGIAKWTAVRFNGKKYEQKADLIGIDLMVKAGYNPIAALTISNKILSEDQYDWWLTHPKGSKRLINIYKYIYKKYPGAFNSDMVKNVNYVNFTYALNQEIKDFQMKEKERAQRNKELL